MSVSNMETRHNTLPSKLLYCGWTDPDFPKKEAEEEFLKMALPACGLLMRERCDHTENTYDHTLKY